ncbi:uncharacterized protein PADG_06132 [Paracoccidioides brasiliensis Pb18]|uniref:Uncharacterized protein n=1 Tax=Paracoccidioides brasiliensis (strain Pb18) TaxID=502780 RepID=C1GFU6_PARBD|nr:uncharacterized protein PADG_06132 [Paracoccidioides brasiliensis Pb18]EEH50053.2 hypothetical protein PADG_06132 [Paracoccidioides brasiliensis Pb18]
MSTHLQFYLPGPCNNATPTHLQSKLEGETQELEKQLISVLKSPAPYIALILLLLDSHVLISPVSILWISRSVRAPASSQALDTNCGGIMENLNWSISVLRGMRQDAVKLRTRARNINHALPDPFESVVHLSWICNRTIYWILELPLAAQVP